MSNHQIHSSIGHLIQVNFERMSAFDKASHAAIDKELKMYFEAKAEESEKNIEQLEQWSSGSTEPVPGKKGIFLPACSVFDRAVYLNKINPIIDAAKRVEKNVVEWYQKIVDGLANVPAEIELMVKGQLLNIKNSKTQLDQLVAV